jgi:hypothetical protein
MKRLLQKCDQKLLYIYSIMDLLLAYSWFWNNHAFEETTLCCFELYGTWPLWLPFAIHSLGGASSNIDVSIFVVTLANATPKPSLLCI